MYDLTSISRYECNINMNTRYGEGTFDIPTELNFQDLIDYNNECIDNTLAGNSIRDSINFYSGTCTFNSQLNLYQSSCWYNLYYYHTTYVRTRRKRSRPK